MLTKEDLKSFDAKKVAPCYFRKLSNAYLLTNDAGKHCILKEDEFQSFIQGKVSEDTGLHKRLKKGGFLREWLDFQALIRTWRERNASLYFGPQLHTLNVTCGINCPRCKEQPGDESHKACLMAKPVAEKIIKNIFESTSPSITIVLQGKDPLLNWEAVKIIIDRSLHTGQRLDKKVALIVETDFSSMSRTKLDFLISNNVQFCTYLNGPEWLHDKLIGVFGGNSFKNTVHWWQEIKSRKAQHGIGAFIRLTRESLKCPKEIVDAYVELGARGIYLRYQHPMRDRRDSEEGYSPEDFLDFYRTCLNYIVDKNLAKGDSLFFEQTARFFLTKILKTGASGTVDLGLLSGAGLSQMAYEFDGGVYPSDEARMLSYAGDETFKIANVVGLDYVNMVSHPVVKTLAVASCLENQPECSRCAFKPFCGISPIYNYLEQGDVFGRMPLNERCQVKKGILDHIFDKLPDPLVKEVFESWVKPGNVVELFHQE